MNAERVQRQRRHDAAALRSGEGAGDHRARPGDDLPGRADDVQRDAPLRDGRRARTPPRCGSACRRRGHAGRGDARLRGEVRLHDPRGLRPVRDLAGGVVQPPRQGAQAGLDRHADRGRRDEAGGRRRQGGAPGRDRRDRDPRPQHHEGLLGPRRRPPPRRSADGWFHSGDMAQGGRGRLLLHRRPQEGADHPRRLQRLPARDRGGALRASRPSQEAAVVGMPDDALGEEVGAAVVLKPGRARPTPTSSRRT